MLNRRIRSMTGRRGQALVEAGITIVLFMTIALGLLTFGHAFMVANMITHAARDGARVAATWPTRGSCGALSGTAPIVSAVQAKIATVTGGTFNVTLSQTPAPPGAAPCGAPATPLVNVNVQGCVPWVFPILPFNFGTACAGGGVGFGVNRTVSFLDEAR
jgi:Flp pilus assembly protein TadG